MGKVWQRTWGPGGEEEGQELSLALCMCDWLGYTRPQVGNFAACHLPLPAWI